MLIKWSTDSLIPDPLTDCSIDWLTESLAPVRMTDGYFLAID